MSEESSGLPLLLSGLAALAVAYMLLGGNVGTPSVSKTIASSGAPYATIARPATTTRVPGRTFAPTTAPSSVASPTSVSPTVFLGMPGPTPASTTALLGSPTSVDGRGAPCIGVPGDECEAGTVCYAGGSPWAVCILPNTLGMGAPAARPTTENARAPSAAVAALSAPPGMDTRFAYTAGAGITAAFSERSITPYPMSTTAEDADYLLIERLGFQRRDYVLSVIVDCSKLPQTERDLVSIQIPSALGDPDIYFVPGVGVYARENGDARSGALELPASGIATVVYTIRGSTDIGSLQVTMSTGAKARAEAHVSWSTGANSSDRLVVTVHNSVLHASFFWAD